MTFTITFEDFVMGSEKPTYSIVLVLKIEESVNKVSVEDLSVKLQGSFIIMCK
jgi:hypothetical protein